jgi:hypothetical protein
MMRLSFRSMFATLATMVLGPMRDARRDLQLTARRVNTPTFDVPFYLMPMKGRKKTTGLNRSRYVPHQGAKERARRRGTVVQ